MEVEPWKALDVDDSDLPTLLRPCKGRRSTAPNTSAATAANPISQSRSSQTPVENYSQQQQQPLHSTSLHRTIPGPAGAVQAAMLRKNLDREHQNFSNNREDSSEDFNDGSHTNGVISTQDYIRRAMEDTAEFDDDFSRQPWISALQFLGAEDGVIRSVPISSIKKCLNASKVDQVVAVIKSCTPDGLGGLIVTLKDPTGTVGASIHHKVLCESEFGKNLTVGAALTLQKVAIFAPVKSAHYLNITLRNLVKVFSQDSGSPTRPNTSAYPIQYADPGIEYNCGKAKTLEKMSTMQNLTMEETAKVKRQCTRSGENLKNHSEIQQQDLLSGSGQTNDRASLNVNAALRRGHIHLSQDPCNEIPEEDIIRTSIPGDHQKSVHISDNSANRGNSEGSLLNKTNNATNSVAKSIGEEIQGTNEVQMQRQPLILKPSLPQWTDEQLDELFAGDEDDGSLF